MARREGFYDYYEAVKQDVYNYITEHKIIDFGRITVEELESEYYDLQERLEEELWTADTVTGNGSGSYTFSRAEALENLSGNFDLLVEAIENFGGDLETIRQGEEACDVTIRCYLLPQAISAVLDDLLELLKEEREQDKQPA